MCNLLLTKMDFIWTYKNFKFDLVESNLILVKIINAFIISTKYWLIKILAMLLIPAKKGIILL